MPNDLGQPLNGKIRNNCRFEHILDNKSKRARCPGFDMRLKRLNITELSSNKSEFRADQVH